MRYRLSAFDMFISCRTIAWSRPNTVSRIFPTQESLKVFLSSSLLHPRRRIPLFQQLMENGVSKTIICGTTILSILLNWLLTLLLETNAWHQMKEKGSMLVSSRMSLYIAILICFSTIFIKHWSNNLIFRNPKTHKNKQFWLIKHRSNILKANLKV